jgi:hypothetical protein
MTAPKPLSLIYSDSDGNHRIDTLEIYYDQELTGTVNLVNIFLYSRTG